MLPVMNIMLSYKLHTDWEVGDILGKQPDDHMNGTWEDTADSCPEYLV